MDAVPITKKLIAFGSKKIYLPKFTIALIRTPNLSPYQARFLVPLDFSKYDLRDYLYHAYNVKCHNITSFVKQMPVRDTVDKPRHWFREESKKYMTVQMETPFVWPEAPENMEPWGKSEAEQARKDMAKSDEMSRKTPEVQREARNALREQVKEVLNKTTRYTHPDHIAVLKKEKAGGTLNQEELEHLKDAKETDQRNQRLSREKLWAKQRTIKSSQSDGTGRQFAIKA